MSENVRSFFTIASNSKERLEHLKKEMQRELDMRNGVMTHWVLLVVINDPSANKVGRDDRGWYNLEGFDISPDPDETGKFIMNVPFPVDLPKEN